MDATQLAASLLEPIPANATFGITVVSAVDGTGEVALVPEPHTVNVIGSLHSSGLVALLDAAGLAAVISAADDAGAFSDIVPLGTQASVEFLAPARGPLRARCTLTDEARAALAPVLARAERKATLSTSVEIVDGGGEVVCRGAFTWRVRRQQAAVDGL